MGPEYGVRELQSGVLGFVIFQGVGTLGAHSPRCSANEFHGSSGRQSSEYGAPGSR